MKMATLGRVSWNLGGLAKAAGVATSGILMASGAAFGQIALDIEVDAPDSYTGGSPVTVTFTIDRTDASGNSDSDVTALGAEIALPAGWKLERDVDANCAISIDDNQVSGTNSTIQVKGANIAFIPGSNPPACSPIPQTGDVLEIFWIPEDGGGQDPLPVDFPVVVTATFIATTCAEDQAIDATVKYRVLAGLEQSNTGADTTSCASSGCALPGDATGDNSVDPGDAQAIFEFFLGIGGVDSEDCADFCTDGSIDPGDAQGVFNQFLGVPDPCNS